jgi:hypothetical protein
MIGTPNVGSPLAENSALLKSDSFIPALYDFTTYAHDLNVAENNNTKYYTIAGDWMPPFELDLTPPNCPQNSWLQFEENGYRYLYYRGPGANYGTVPVFSVESLPHFSSLWC